jgi:hypothetical protein
MPESNKRKITLGYQYGEGDPRVYLQCEVEHFLKEVKNIQENLKIHPKAIDLWFHEILHYGTPLKFILDVDLKLSELSSRDRNSMEKFFFKGKKEFMEKVVKKFFIKDLVVYLNQKWNTSKLKETSFLIYEACSNEKMSAHIILNGPPGFYFENPRELNECLKDFKKTKEKKGGSEELLKCMDMNVYGSMRIPFGIKRGDTRRLLPYINGQFYDYEKDGLNLELLRSGLLSNVHGIWIPIQLPPKPIISYKPTFNGNNDNNQLKLINYEYIDYETLHSKTINDLEFKKDLFDQVRLYYEECGYKKQVRGQINYRKAVIQGTFDYGYNVTFTVPNLECLIKIANRKDSKVKPSRSFVLDLRTANLKPYCFNFKECANIYPIKPKKLLTLFEKYNIPLATPLEENSNESKESLSIKRIEKRQLNENSYTEKKISKKNHSIVIILGKITPSPTLESYYFYEVENSISFLDMTFKHSTLEVIHRFSMDLDFFLEKERILLFSLKKYEVSIGDFNFYQEKNFKNTISDSTFIEMVELSLGLLCDVEFTQTQ